mmetsp:Transcript_40724/g.122663  ORF Transcript_40724/g.122663 Transcript_40724/m.122663 type:complete len:195 (-) Transcript_40724:3-587(-)
MRNGDKQILLMTTYYGNNDGTGTRNLGGPVGGTRGGGGSLLEHGYEDFSPVPFDELDAIDLASSSLGAADGGAANGGGGHRGASSSASASDSTSTSASASASERHGKHQMNFPAKLHYILSTASTTKLDDGRSVSSIISWLDHGRAWRVHRPKEFMPLIASKCFSQSKYTSFIRQVNGWGFRRIGGGGAGAGGG